MARLLHRTAVAALAACAVGGALAQDTPLYRVRDLNALTGLDNILVPSLNNRGDVTLIDNDTSHGFLWRGGKLHDLGAWGGGLLELNERGEVVGTQRLGDGSRVPFLWRNGRSINLAGALGASSGEAHDINESGQVVGSADGRAFVYDGKRARYLDIPGASAFSALAINDAGVIAGGLSHAGDGLDQRAYLLRKGTAQTLPAPILFEAGGYYRSTALNNAGSAVVFWHDANWGESGSALFVRGKYFDLGFETFAQDINNRDWATGYSVAEVDWDVFEFTALVAHDGQQYSLNKLMTAGSDARWDRLEFANAINDRGQIVGGGTLSDGSGRAFIATPVPEAPGLAMMLAGLSALGVALRARRRGGSATHEGGGPGPANTTP